MSGGKIYKKTFPFLFTSVWTIPLSQVIFQNKDKKEQKQPNQKMKNSIHSLLENTTPPTEFFTFLNCSILYPLLYVPTGTHPASRTLDHVYTSLTEIFLVSVKWKVLSFFSCHSCARTPSHSSTSSLSDPFKRKLTK